MANKSKADSDSYLSSPLPDKLLNAPHLLHRKSYSMQQPSLPSQPSSNQSSSKSSSVDGGSCCSDLKKKNKSAAAVPLSQLAKIIAVRQADDDIIFENNSNE